ncbi:MAG: hypothetical protein ACI8V0_003161 [Pseudohongiellaceae bacterium]|jgi:hypothetical protein
MTLQCFDSLNEILKPLALRLAAIGLIAIAPIVFAESGSYRQLACVSQVSDVIGCVTLVLGKAHIESGQNNREKVAAGTQIHVGDQIITQSNGTVHISFIDKASVSVRQDSHLEIINYKYDEANPQNSRVKFNLVHGVTRAISGNAAKGAREQFRLNTPIAAIGVRGTDFVVSATDSSTQAQVNEGIIVMAPFSVNCSTDSFGPCIANSLELTGDSMEMIALDDSGSSPRIMPAAQDRGSEVLQQEARSLLASNINDANQADTGDEPYVEEVFVEEANSTLVAANTTTSTSLADPITPEPEAPGTVTPEPEIPDTVIPEPEIPDFTPEIPVTALALAKNQLVWGRFSQGKGDLERITLSAAQATLGREATILGGDYILYRDDADANRGVDRNLSVVNFALDSAQAFYNSSTGVVAMQVVDGSLGIDFQQNSFATQLNLNHDLTGQVDFIAAGNLFDGGFFRSSNDTQRISGSVSFDGTEAGYFFERQLEGGFIDGLTLWNSQ